jgi:hypothetical protein
MKKGVLLIVFLLSFTSVYSQFKTVETATAGTPRFDNIGDVTNIKLDDPKDVIIPPSADFDFDAIAKTSIERNNFNEAKAVWSEKRNIPLAIFGLNGAAPDEQLPIEEKCYQYLENIKDYLQIKDVRSGFVIKDVNTDDLGIVHVRMQQYFRGIPFYGGEIMVHIKMENHTS